MRLAQSYPDGVIENSIADELRDNPFVCPECALTTDNPLVRVLSEHGHRGPSGWEWEATVSLQCLECREVEIRTFNDEG